MPLFGRDKTTMVSPEDAMPGRDQPIPVPDTHVVLGTPMQGPWPDGHEVLYVAMGCFWGAERLFWQIEGVHSTAAGYMGGWTKHPTYEETCTAMTGHTESVQVVYDPDVVDIDVLLAAFWENHDPTTPNRQGNDVGTQYRSAIYTTTDAQHEAVLASRDKYQAALAEQGFGEISTEIARSSDAGDGVFYYAEDYHQQYLHKNPRGYCNHGFCQVSYG
ncbi:peptide-methionine (S)-S-oxide reductase MsrA [Acidimicrobiia bacterium EGI L10123]|uniref:peptide-methionine (S)-S-oxide reductase MsrA n=1 Tax=Salinilacustrithrix flava TaxID=2957203 RepID=UPI003D7C232B|nr:peptide-methionine (S)-S-oxide reductase MsrA [Acidimicrobiia bacterium EGI L10123]